MKITNLLLLFVAILSITSCGKDDEENSSDDIVGTWELTVFEYDGTSSTEFAGETFTSDFMGTGRDMSAEVQFNADGTYESRGSYTIDLTYGFAGQSFTQPLTITDFVGSGTYSIQGNQMIATSTGGDPTIINITKLEGDDLEMEFALIQSTTQQGATSTTTINGDYTLKRK